MSNQDPQNPVGVLVEDIRNSDPLPHGSPSRHNQEWQTRNNHDHPRAHQQPQHIPCYHAPLSYLEVTFTIISTILIAVVVIIYMEKHNMSKDQKHASETLTTGLILLLGLNFAVSHGHKMCAEIKSSD